MLYGLLLLQPGDATCELYPTCDQISSFYRPITLSVPMCDFGMHPYIKSVVMDSESDTYTTTNTLTSTQYSACSYESETCHSSSSSLCSYSELANPVITLHCENYVTACTVRYHVEYGCSCRSCTNCDYLSDFAGYIDITPQSCGSNQYWYISSIQIDSPDGDLFTNHTYKDAARSESLWGCVSDYSPACSAFLSGVDCGKYDYGTPFARITYANSNGKSCRVKQRVPFMRMELPDGMTLPPTTTTTPTSPTPTPIPTTSTMQLAVTKQAQSKELATSA